MTKKSPKKKRNRVPNPLDQRFMIRCSSEELQAYEAEAERAGFRRGPHDSGVGMLIRAVMNGTRIAEKSVLPGTRLGNLYAGASMINDPAHRVIPGDVHLPTPEFIAAHKAVNS